MPLILALAALAALVLAWQSPSLRAAMQKRPGQTLFLALCAVALVLVSFRTGRHWLALIVAAGLIWGRKLLPLLVGARAAASGAPRAEPPPGAAHRMSRAEALEVLGLEEGVTPEEIQSRYRTLMKSIHPDRGGSSYLAKRVNEAKRVLLDT